jgi:ribonuclease HI
MDFFKLNFDGTSKGNPGAAGFVEVIRNHQGSILLLTTGNLGHTTKNAVELWGLTTGLQLALKHHFNKLIVEGDSQIILNLFQKILNGADLEQVSPCWCLTHGLRTITTLL